MALILGTAVAFVSYVLPIPFLFEFGGGALAGYLRGDDPREGALVGGLIGLVVSLPLVAIFVAIGGVFWLILVLEAQVILALLVLLFTGFMVVFYVVYHVGIVMAGGVVGAAVSDRSAPRPSGDGDDRSPRTPSPDRATVGSNRPVGHPDTVQSPGH